MLDNCCYAVVMAGGYGTRLWPLSRRNHPKHLLRLFGGKSLVEMTIEKLKDYIPENRTLILTSVHYRSLTKQTLPCIPAENFIFEPCVRDTASAIGLAAMILKERCEEATMVVLTSDQIIEPADKFKAAIVNAVDFLQSNPDMLIAFGVKATSASTLVGWQELGHDLVFPDCRVRKIVKFTEKPDSDTAQRYMAAGNYCWNSGQFAWKAKSILEEIDAYLPDATDLLKQIGAAWQTSSRDHVLNSLFPQMPTSSIDYKIMQKTNKACSILLPCSWEDMGTHKALIGRIGANQKGNIIAGNAIVVGEGSAVLNTTDQSVVVAHDNVVVVVTEDAVFIGDIATDMKALVEHVSQWLPDLL